MRAEAHSAYLAAHALREAGSHEEALSGFRECLAAFPAGSRVKLRYKALVGAAHCATGLRDWRLLESLSRQAVELFPKAAEASFLLGAALVRQERFGEARGHLERSVALDPASTDARALLEIAGRTSVRSQPERRPRIWPMAAARFADLPHLVRRFLLEGLPRGLSLAPSTAFLTLGSCFAENLARRLQESGYAVHHEPLGEEVNSTFANRYLLEWIEEGALGPETAVMETVYGPVLRERFRQALASSEVVVLTLGVAACFFDQDDGAFIFSPSKATRELLARTSAMRTTTVAENAINIRRIVSAVRRLARPDASVVLTVSPVPLTGTTEHASAVIADCLSKSTLRLACQEVLEDRDPGIHYWPSFEIVRWLGAHLGPDLPAAYGADDGNSRHVSSWLVDMIVDLFIEHHRGKADRAAGPQEVPALG